MWALVDSQMRSIILHDEKEVDDEKCGRKKGSVARAATRTSIRVMSAMEVEVDDQLGLFNRAAMG